MKIVILAGGRGTRLWPISRTDSPKQFNKLDILWGESLFQHSLKRALYLVEKNDIFIVVNNDNFFHAEIQAEELGILIDKQNFIFQPSMKETLAIIALSVSKIKEDYILFLPSDQIIDDLDWFKNSINNEKIKNKEWITIFWVKPNKPEIGFGYIEKENSNEEFSKVKKFHEKPNKELAKKYIEKWYLWNAWIFLFHSTFFKELLNEINPTMKKLIFDSKISDEEKFNNIEVISIDKWLIEKTDKIFCVNLNSFWTDLGSFDSIWNYSDKKNILQKNIIIEWNTKNNFVLSETKNKEICLVDIQDLIIIDSEDVLLISKKWSTEKVKKLLKYSKNLIWNIGYRPWGYYKIINEWVGFKTKKLYIFPWKKLSLQSHNHRSEHWVIVEWTAKIHLGKWQSEDIEIITLPKWESIFVAIWQLHRIENSGILPLVIIETQIWDYLWEDDIKRYKDDFWRK